MFAQESQSQPLLQSARQNFVKKVYSTLSLQLIFTVIVVYSIIQTKSLAKYLNHHTWIFWTSLVGGIITLAALQFGSITRKFPINYFVMAGFTVCESILVGYVCMGYDTASVFLSAVATLAATLGLTYYAMTTKQDFTSASFIGKGMFYSFCWTISLISFLNFFILRSGMVAFVLAVGFAVAYSAYLLIDTQLILGNKEKRIDLDDYIWGATTLYTDIISLFLKILQILGKRKDD